MDYRLGVDFSEQPRGCMLKCTEVNGLIKNLQYFQPNKVSDYNSLSTIDIYDQGKTFRSHGTSNNSISMNIYSSFDKQL